MRRGASVVELKSCCHSRRDASAPAALLLLAGVALAAVVAVGCAPDAPPPEADPDGQPAELPGALPGDAAGTGALVTGADPELGPDGQPRATSRLRIDTNRAPAAIGPYSQAVLAGNTLYLAGQIALDPATGEMVGGGDIRAETRQVMENLGAVLAAAGFAFDQVVQSQVFLVDLDDFGAMNEVYAGYFGDVPPARATVGVASLPRGARVEIIMTAVR
jgi:2-iminobutanoate/2-iminopropanoate deaminase